MKQFLVYITIIILLSGCSGGQKSGQPIVSASIVPQQFFINQIAGNWLKVNVMVPPGSSPATYEPTPIQMKNLTHSDIYFRIGHIGFEKAWMDKLASINPDMKVVNTAAGLDLIMEEEWNKDDHHDHDSPDHNHDGYNPHIWLSPKLVKKQAESIFNVLSKKYPEHLTEMQSRLNRFLTKVDSVQNKLDRILDEQAETPFIVYHPVWTYLANDYHLKQIAIEHNGKEASVDKLKNIIDYAKANNIKLIIAQKEFNAAQAKTIASEINGEVLLLNPLDYDWFKIMNEFIRVFE